MWIYFAELNLNERKQKKHNFFLAEIKFLVLLSSFFHFSGSAFSAPDDRLSYVYVFMLTVNGAIPMKFQANNRQSKDKKKKQEI